MNGEAKALKEGNGLRRRKHALNRDSIYSRIDKRRVRFLLEQDVVDGGKEPASDSDTGLLSPTTLLEDLVLGEDFRVTFGARVSGCKSALNQQRLDVLPSFTNASGFLLTSAFVVLWRQTRPRAQVLGGFKLPHVNADFSNDANCCHWVGDTGDGQEQQ